MAYFTDPETNEALIKLNKKKIQKQLALISLNEEEPGTCGSCKYTDNDIGMVALHCTCKKKEAKEVWHDESGKVRSWEKCKHWKERK